MSSIDASLWIGQEKEYDSDGLKMFVDGSSAKQIKEALEDHNEVCELHFAHEIRWDIIRKFNEKIDITVEVDSPKQVPRDLVGRINVILRVPAWVDKTKIRDGKEITVVDFNEAESVEWGGQKVYKDDEVIL